MGKTFDELYDDFFNKNSKSINKTNTKKDDLFDMLTNLNKLEEQIEKMGKPDKIEFYNENDVFFEKRIWYTENGDIVKLIISDEPFIEIPTIKEKSLQEKLTEAIAEEDYEKAVEIRNEINKNKKK
jgi:hypothetical protein